jgi:DNA polymerase-3 subunit alpha
VDGDYMAFTYLNLETHYALNGSTIQIDALIEQAKEFDFASLAMAEFRMYGVLRFYKACKKENIKPIIGLRIFLEGLNSESRNLVVLYAKNHKGYLNLIKLATISASNGYVSVAEMKELNGDLYGVYMMPNSELLQFKNSGMKKEFVDGIKLLNETFSEYFVSYSDSVEMNQYFDKLEKLIYMEHVQYLNEDDKELSSVLKGIFNVDNDSLFEDKTVPFKRFDESGYEYKNALKNVGFLVERCNVDIPTNMTLLPEYPVQGNHSSKAYLRALVKKGFEKRFEGIEIDRKLYSDRLNYELKVIDDMGYNDYFLIVWDFVKYARKNKYLIGPGRGSAAASLVSYCLGITSVDSIKYDLVFERFLNPERITMPDIDMDLPDDKRDDIIRYVKEFYGETKVASICTFGTFQKNSAIRDTARALQIEGMIVEDIIKIIEQYPSIKEAFHDDGLMNIMNQNMNAKKLCELASNIEGLNRHVSTHAAGIIVSKEDLTSYTALQPGLLEMYQTQFEAKDLEDIGLLKIDFLGLRNLSIIDNITTMIYENENQVVDIYKVPLDDSLTFDLLRKVQTTGVFQLESGGMRSLIGKMQMKEFEDIVTVLALFRPGPMENIPEYIKRRFDEEEVSYPHPSLKEILKSTNGIIIYQEQIVKIASVFAGYTLGEADLLRRAVSKKQESVLIEERKNFVLKASKLGHSNEVSNEIYDYIVKFANYGFNRAHSVAYALVSYWMAYLKANYPKYFIAVLTSSVIGSESQMRNYIFEAHKLGVEVLKPSVNTSSMKFEVEEDNLRYPLLGIKNLGINAVRSILEERQNGSFKGYVDFVSRMHKLINKRVIESLIKAGALDEFKLSKRTMLERFTEVVNFSNLGGFIDSEEFVLRELKEYNYQTLEQYEHSVLGFNLAMNPLNEFTEYIEKHHLLKPADVNKDIVGKEIRIIGIISYIRKIKTKSGKDMAFISIVDELNKLDGVLFDGVFIEYKGIIEKNKVYLFMAKVEHRNNNIQLVISKIHKM